MMFLQAEKGVVNLKTQNQDNIICDIAREIEKFNQQTFEK